MLFLMIKNQFKVLYPFSQLSFLTFVKKYTGLLLFSVFVFIALFSFDEYGISWDEIQQHTTGEVNYNYVFNGNEELLGWWDRDYGVAFELPLIILEKALHLSDSRDIYLMRHLVTHLFFLTACLCFFLLVNFLYKNKWLATIGFLSLALHPRIYGHSFFNSKDVPFLSMLIICLYLTALALNKKTWYYFFLLGISTGLLINLRIMGVIVPAVILMLLITDIIATKNYSFYPKMGALYLLTVVIVLYITWPFLWPDPVDNFILAFKNMAQFRWSRNVLFKGELIKATQLRWNYIPVWFTITTSLTILFAGFLGTIILLGKLFKNPKDFFQESTERENLSYLMYCYLPVLAVIILHSVLYDGWRQMYFIYPSFVLLAIYGLSVILKHYPRFFIITNSILCFTFVINTLYMFNNFPLQHVYFNEAFAFYPSEYTRKNYELDYWGPSYRESLEYILLHDSTSSIAVYAENDPGEYNLVILPKDQKKRLHFTDMENADYFITNYRWHPEEYIELQSKKWHSFTVQGSTVNQIFKLKEE